MIKYLTIWFLIGISYIFLSFYVSSLDFNHQNYLFIYLLYKRLSKIMLVNINIKRTYDVKLRVKIK